MRTLCHPAGVCLRLGRVGPSKVSQADEAERYSSRVPFQTNIYIPLLLAVLHVLKYLWKQFEV